MKLKYQLNYERAFANLMCKQGHHCERIAGSGLRQKSVCDCILFKDRKAYLVELKATKENIFRINGRTRIQVEKLIDVAIKHGLIPLLVIRFKRRNWNFIILDHNYPRKIIYNKNQSIEQI